MWISIYQALEKIKAAAEIAKEMIFVSAKKAVEHKYELIIFTTGVAAIYVDAGDEEHGVIANGVHAVVSVLYSIISMANKEAELKNQISKLKQGDTMIRIMSELPGGRFTELEAKRWGGLDRFSGTPLKFKISVFLASVVGLGLVCTYDYLREKNGDRTDDLKFALGFSCGTTFAIHFLFTSYTDYMQKNLDTFLTSLNEKLKTRGRTLNYIVSRIPGVQRVECLYNVNGLSHQLESPASAGSSSGDDVESISSLEGGSVNRRPVQRLNLVIPQQRAHSEVSSTPESSLSALSALKHFFSTPPATPLSSVPLPGAVTLSPNKSD